MRAVACSRNLVAPARQGPGRSHHEWHIPQSNQPLAQSRDLVTHAARGADRGRNPGGQRARPARGRRAPGRGSTRRCLAGSAKRPDWRPCSRADMRRPSSSVAACGCDGQNRKTARNTSTCAVQTAPSPLPDWVEQDSPIGHAHARTHSLKKTELTPRRRRVNDVDQKKTDAEENARSNRLKKARFGSALTPVSCVAGRAKRGGATEMKPPGSLRSLPPEGASVPWAARRYWRTACPQGR